MANVIICKYSAFGVCHLYAQPTQEIVPLVLQIVEYFAVNISLTGYMMVLFYAVRDSKYKTSHYAFIAAIMMLANMVPSMISSCREMLIINTIFLLFCSH